MFNTNWVFIIFTLSCLQSKIVNKSNENQFTANIITALKEFSQFSGVSFLKILFRL